MLNALDKAPAASGGGEGNQEILQFDYAIEKKKILNGKKNVAVGGVMPVGCLLKPGRENRF